MTRVFAGCLQRRKVEIGGLGKAFDCVVKHVHVFGSARGGGILVQDRRAGYVALGIPIHGEKPQHFMLESA